MSAKTSRSIIGWPVYLVLVFVLIFSVLAAIEFFNYTPTDTEHVPEATLTADSYLDKVTPLLADASAERGAELVVQYGCTACHREGAVNGIAPSFTGIGERVGTRRPPLAPEAYIYESINFPLAYVVEGFTPAMPLDFSSRIPAAEQGDIIAFLLSPDAH
ncbi:MAG: c-type cytochrome [Anaerolineaceae bacterium]|nr:c-type cytochrome [Anaerolineaceae bacterium]